MHIAAILILMLITSFIGLFSEIIAGFAGSIPAEFADLLGFYYSQYYFY